VAAVAEKLDTDKKSAGAMVDAVLEVVTETVSTGEPVAISGFAKFARVDRPARMGRNPATGATIRIKASRKVRITPLKAFKDAVMTGKRSAAKKAAVKKTTATKAPARKTTARKTTATKAPARKTTARTTAAVKKAPVKRVTVKKAPVKKTVAKRAPVKKTVAKKAPVRKTTARGTR